MKTTCKECSNPFQVDEKDVAFDAESWVVWNEEEYDYEFNS